MPTYFQVLTEFMSYPKTQRGLHADFYQFLEKQYPAIFNQLSLFYADDETFETHGNVSRQHRTGWDALLKPNPTTFAVFLESIKSIWLVLTEQDFGECFYCKEQRQLEVEHSIVVGFERNPIFISRYQYEMDGGVFTDVACCRECAKALLKATAPYMIEKEELACVF